MESCIFLAKRRKSQKRENDHIFACHPRGDGAMGIAWQQNIPSLLAPSRHCVNTHPGGGFLFARISTLDRSLLILICSFCMIKFAVNLKGRPKEIFVIVVGEFIKTARPVGSEFLAENYDLAVSSATIRNDLAFLERLGFLNKPHTSGGRVPTADGWHYFVEKVWEPSRLKEEETIKFENSVSNLINASLEVRKCASKVFPEMSEEFLKRFLIDKIFTKK